jgi:hypothetical protein
MDDAAANFDRDSLRSILRAELVHDVFNVDLYHLLRDRKTLANVTITIAFGHALENVDLPLGQESLPKYSATFSAIALGRCLRPE